jgi:hypothetical protein
MRRRVLARVPKNAHCRHLIQVNKGLGSQGFYMQLTWIE